MHQLKTIKELLYSVGDMDKVAYFFRDYGGMEEIGNYTSNREQLEFWKLPQEASGHEMLLRSGKLPFGQLRLVKYKGVEQEYIRSSQNPWDTGGIMDINLRVHDVKASFEELREMGWHGLSDPLFQEMGPFKLYDILMKGYDDIIIAFTHRTQPPLELPEGMKIPSHVYNSSLIVKDLQKSREFYEKGLGFQVLNEYTLIKDKPQENMFGLPYNLADKVACKALILSPEGIREVIFQLIEFEGVCGKDFSSKALPPNRGLLLYRCEVAGIEAYYQDLLKKGIRMHQELREVLIEPYGKQNCFAILSPNGVCWEFIESVKS